MSKRGIERVFRYHSSWALYDADGEYAKVRNNVPSHCVAQERFFNVYLALPHFDALFTYDEEG